MKSKGLVNAKVHAVNYFDGHISHNLFTNKIIILEKRLHNHQKDQKYTSF